MHLRKEQVKELLAATLTVWKKSDTIVESFYSVKYLQHQLFCQMIVEVHFFFSQ